MKNMIIGITGTNAAGKGEVVHFLQEKYGFNYYSMSGLIAELFEKKFGREHQNRDELRDYANELRAEHGPMHIVDLLYARAQEAGGSSVIESLRAVAEVRRIKKHGGVVVGVDAKPELRWERAKERGDVKDSVTFKEFCEQERREQNPDDPTKQNIPACLDLAEMIFDNGGSLASLHERVEQFVEWKASERLPK